MTNLVALAARVEQETPSPELDAEVARAIGWKQNADYRRWETPEGRMFAPLAPFTESVDEAMKLKPAGLHLDLRDWTWTSERCWRASLQSSNGSMLSIFVAKGQTAAAAIAAVGLKARAALKDPS